MQPEFQSAQLTQLRGLRVLLVEDEPDIADLFTFVLKDYGAEVIGASTALEGFQALNQQPDVLVCNIWLPDMDGKQLLQLIRAQPSKLISAIPAIAVTSHTRDVSASDVSHSGFDRFLHKPIDADQLVGEILALVRR